MFELVKKLKYNLNHEENNSCLVVDKKLIVVIINCLVVQFSLFTNYSASKFLKEIL